MGLMDLMQKQFEYEHSAQGRRDQKRLLIGYGIFVAVWAIILCVVFVVPDWIQSSREQKIEKYLSVGEFEKARGVANKFDYKKKVLWLKKINSEHLALFINEDDWEGALSLTKSMRCFDAYQAVFSDNLDKLLREEKYDFIFNTLDSWQFNERFRAEVTYEELKSKVMEVYCEEVADYNSTLDRILRHAISTKNRNLAKNVLSRYNQTPYRTSERTYGLNDDAKKEAQKKLKAAKLL